MDDFIPCAATGDVELVLPCFAHTDVPGELWPMILEKAWAKLY